MWKNTRNVFCKTRAVRNTCSKGNIDHSKCAGSNRQDMCIFFVLNVENPRNVFYKTCAARNTNSCRKPATDKIYAHILRSKCRKTPEMLSIKRVPLVTLFRKEMSIVAIVRWQQQTRYMCIFFVLNVEKHQKCFL